MRCFLIESTLRYSDTRGFGEAYLINCPVCWSASILLIKWENDTEETGECPVCERMIRSLNSE